MIPLLYATVYLVIDKGGSQAEVAGFLNSCNPGLRYTRHLRVDVAADEDDRDSQVVDVMMLLLINVLPRDCLRGLKYVKPQNFSTTPQADLIS